MRKMSFIKKSIGMVLAAGLMMASMSGCGSSQTSQEAADSGEPVVMEATEASDDDGASYATSASSDSNKSDASENYETYEYEAAEESYDVASDSANYAGEEELDGMLYDNSTGKGYFPDDSKDDYYSNSDSRNYSHVAENDFIQTSEVTSTATSVFLGMQ